LGTPPHAAVDATVGAMPRKTRGFVNAVLRKVASAPLDWPDEATRLSYPDWIIARLTADLGHDDAVAALEAMNRPATVTTRADGYRQDPASTLVAGETVAPPAQAPPRSYPCLLAPHASLAAPREPAVVARERRNPGRLASRPGADAP
jgi:16S rRNA (cytosine967-C5)-methyltransferase